MNKMKKVIGFVVLIVSLVTTAAFARHEQHHELAVQEQEIFDKLPIDKILTSHAVAAAFDEVKLLLLAKLSSKKGAFTSFLSFACNNKELFAKWREVCKDFVQELKKTVSAKDAKDLVTALCGCKKPHEPATKFSCDHQDAERKEHVISAILKNGKSAFASLIALGAGYVANFRAPPGSFLIEVSQEQSVEEKLQNALRTALQRLTVSELEALQKFSETPAFNIVAVNAQEFILLFITQIIKKDPSVITEIINYATQQSSQYMSLTENGSLDPRVSESIKLLMRKLIEYDPSIVDVLSEHLAGLL